MASLMEVPSDQRLVAAVLGGSRDALGELYTRHSPDVFNTAYRLIGTREEAEDVLQDVFVALPAVLTRSYEERGRFGGWLNRLAVTTALTRMRTRSRRRESGLPEEATESAAAAAQGHGSDASVERIALERALAAMPVRLRAVFVLKEIEGYSHAEIGELLGITRLTSATRLSRAWARLRKELAS
jgi:RNA polymerase sigma-70 factor, ECF subfamily